MQKFLFFININLFFNYLINLISKMLFLRIKKNTSSCRAAGSSVGGQQLPDLGPALGGLRPSPGSICISTAYGLGQLLDLGLLEAVAPVVAEQEEQEMEVGGEAEEALRVGWELAEVGTHRLAILKIG